MNTVPNEKKHLYPIKIALRAQRLIQGTVFYDVFVDTVAGQYFKVVPNGVQSILED